MTSLEDCSLPSSGPLSIEFWLDIETCCILCNQVCSQLVDQGTENLHSRKEMDFLVENPGCSARKESVSGTKASYFYLTWSSSLVNDCRLTDLVVQESLSVAL